MGAGAILEPLAVVLLLFGGAWLNRVTHHPSRAASTATADDGLAADLKADTLAASSSPSLLLPGPECRWRQRELRWMSYRRVVETPDTAVFRHGLLSRLLAKFPFLVEAWYWALIYWIYQLGRAVTAVSVVEGTVHVARRHALQVIRVEEHLHLFWELPIQRFFLSHPGLMVAINWLYSFIHIPGTIAFLVGLYYYTVTANRRVSAPPSPSPSPAPCDRAVPAGPGLYEARRRTMAACNLLAFVVFTLWPCMPPRLLSDPTYRGPQAGLAQSYGFVDTVHGEHGSSSVWTQNRFCNQYAAMPSLHFGYSLLVGLTIATIPLPPHHRRARSVLLPIFNNSHPELAPAIRVSSPRRLACLAAGLLYPAAILIAIVATANHFILDAVAGAAVCAMGWKANHLLLNLVPLEDYFLWWLRIHKPAPLPAAYTFRARDVKGWGMKQDPERMSRVYVERPQGRE